MIDKSLKEISWQVDEPTYRSDPALSYSTLAKYERSGFNGLSQLFDKIETPSLTFGSMVDEMITGTMESFNDRFLIAEFPSISDNLIQIAKTLFNSYKGEYENVSDIPDDILAKVGEECDFYVASKFKNYRVKLIKENCNDYYRLLYLSQDKTIVTSKDYQDAVAAVQALRGSAATSWYFQEDNPFDGIERLYQLKFKATFNNVDYRVMMDLAIVDHNNKTIRPIDLKTSSKKEYDFYKSFVEWSYQIQNRLYTRVLEDNIKKDPYFKDFTILPYLDIVVCRSSLIPLVWECPFSKEYGTLSFGKNKQIIMRDPFEIGEELNEYLTYSYQVPKDIDLDEPNNLEEWLNKL